MRKSSLVYQYIFFGAALAIATGACVVTRRDTSDHEGSGAILVITHPRPNLTAPDVAAFVAAGCTQDGDELDCAAVPAIKAFGCFRDRLGVDELVSAVLSVVSCDIPTAEGVSGVFRVGCRAARERRYVVASRGQFQLLSTKEELAEMARPVDSPEKALALAAALTGAQPMYSIEMDGARRYLEDRLETTYTKAVPGGYQARLFETEICGCGLHPTSAVDFVVSRAGELRRAADVAVYELANEICVD